MFRRTSELLLKYQLHLFPTDRYVLLIASTCFKEEKVKRLDSETLLVILAYCEKFLRLKERYLLLVQNKRRDCLFLTSCLHTGARFSPEKFPNSKLHSIRLNITRAYGIPLRLLRKTGWNFSTKYGWWTVKKPDARFLHVSRWLLRKWNSTFCFYSPLWYCYLPGFNSPIFIIYTLSIVYGRCSARETLHC